MTCPGEFIKLITKKGTAQIYLFLKIMKQWLSNKLIRPFQNVKVIGFPRDVIVCIEGIHDDIAIHFGERDGIIHITRFPPAVSIDLRAVPAVVFMSPIDLIRRNPLAGKGFSSIPADTVPFQVIFGAGDAEISHQKNEQWNHDP